MPQEAPPCIHLGPAPQGTCGLGRTVPHDCGLGCAAYSPGLTDAERTPCEVWTRVMGYHRPVSMFNKGKQSEHAQRRHFLEAKR